MNASQKKIIQLEFTVHALEELLAVSESSFLKEAQKLEEVNEKLEESIQQHEKLENDIEQILDASSDAIRVIDKNYNIIYTSKSFNLLHGHPENIIGKKCYDVVPEKECFTEECSLKRIIKTGKKFTIERTLNTVDGRKKIYGIDVIPYNDSNGNFLGIIKNYRDVTEKRQAEEKLAEEVREHEELAEKYRILFDASGDAIMLNDEKRFFDCNKAALELFGFSRKEFLKLGPVDVTTAKQANGQDSSIAARKHMEKAAREGIDLFEWNCVRKDGSIFPSEVMLSRMEYQGKIVNLAIVRDIAERKEAETKLVELSEEYRVLFESSADAILMQDKEKLIDCNNACLELFGFSSKEEFIGLRPIDISPTKQPDGRDSIVASMEHMEKACREGIDFFEWTMKKKDGTLFPAEALLSNMKFKDNIVMQATLRDITERKQAEERLADEIREREKLAEKYRILFDTSGDAIMLLNDQGFFDCNKATLKLFGFSSKKQFMKTHPGDLSVEKQPDGRDSFTAANEHIEKAFREGTEFFEWVHKRRDSTPFFAEILLSRMEYKGEAVVQATVRDITERKHAEEKLAELSEEYRVLFESSADAIMLHAQEKLIDCNKASLELFGFSSKEELAKMSPGALSPAKQPDGRDSFKASIENMEKACREGTNFFEWFLMRKDGTIFPAEILLSRLEYQGNIMLQTTIRNITERKQAEEKIRSISAIQNLILENSTIGIGLVRNRIFEWVNPRVGELLMLPVEKIQGASTRVIFPSKESYEELGRGAYPMLVAGGSSDNTLQLKRNDGSLFWCRFIGKALDPAKVQDGSIWMFEDITEEKEAQKIAGENAQQKGRIEMANNMLHDIGNAMTGISTYVLKPQMEKIWQEIKSLYQLRDLFTDSEDKLIKVFGTEKQHALDEFMKALIISFEGRRSKQREFSEKISSAVGHVCSVLDLQRHYLREKTSPLSTKISLLTIINDTLVMLSGSLKKRNIKVSLNVKDENLNISGDQTRLMRVFLNIIKNTCESFDELESIKDGRKLEITIALHKDKKRVKTVFSDNGIGFAVETSNGLFERGFTSKLKGSGIGLHECRSIIESHSGTISMKSDGINTGALTIITFPIFKYKEGQL